MDKHTRRYMYDYFGMETEGDFNYAHAVHQANDEEALTYLSSAVSYLPDSDIKTYLKYKIMDKRMGGIFR